jgi:hypothetical protein
MECAMEKCLLLPSGLLCAVAGAAGKISGVRRTVLVMKDGTRYESAGLCGAPGVKPR